MLRMILNKKENPCGSSLTRETEGQRRKESEIIIIIVIFKNTAYILNVGEIF